MKQMDFCHVVPTLLYSLCEFILFVKPGAFFYVLLFGDNISSMLCCAGSVMFMQRMLVSLLSAAA